MRYFPILVACIVACIVACTGSDPAAPTGDAGPTDAQAATATLSGYAFAFGGTGAAVPGATIALAEHPEVQTATAADGTYTLTVPADEPVTPFVTHEGFRTMHLQTFTLAPGEAAGSVNFQMVNETFYQLFATVLAETPRDDRCQIASTVNVAAVFGLSREAFIAYGAHGISGATVALEPDVRETVYFTATTIPDRSLTETTDDGGVVWPNVPKGVYTVRATHADKEIAPFVARCEPGRFINAGPPHGLRELK